MTEDTDPSLRVAAEIASERMRQTAKWPIAHDDHHDDGSLALAAALYATPIPLVTVDDDTDPVVATDPWPWKREHLIGGTAANDGDERGTYDRRRRLVVAAALIVAEIERIDRKAARDGSSEDELLLNDRIPASGVAHESDAGATQFGG